MSKIGLAKIIDGLRDALKYAEGETKDNKEHTRQALAFKLLRSWILSWSVVMGLKRR